VSINSYRLQEFPFDKDEWEFLHSLPFLKPKGKVNLLDVGEGDVSLLYAVATVLQSKMQRCYSLDPVNKTGTGEMSFYQKRSVISVIQNRGCHNSIAIEDDLEKPEVVKDVEEWLGEEEKINLLIFEFVKDENYCDSFFQMYNHLFADDMMIYYHGLKKNEFSEKFFDNLANQRKYVKLVNNQGIGIILD
jgi:hypothetical protein